LLRSGRDGNHRSEEQTPALKLISRDHQEADMDREFFNSTTSWGAIAAGAVVTCAVTLFVTALCVGGGLAIVSPWSGEGVSASTFGWTAGVGVVCIALIASAIGGYITGRLRHGWDDIHADERYFRDTAHGFVTWAFATILTVSVLAGAGTHLLAAASTGAIPAAGAGAAQAASSNDIYVDRLLRSNTPNQNANPADTRAELSRVLAPIARRGGQISQDDRAYMAQVVAARTGLSQDEAQKRVDQTIAQAKDAADKARKAALAAALWAAIALLAGALAASIAAAEGGKLRNTRWYEVTTVTTSRM
jgi:hypothetical protein